MSRDGRIALDGEVLAEEALLARLEARLAGRAVGGDGAACGVGMLTFWSAAEPPRGQAQAAGEPPRGQAQAAGTGGVEIALGPAGRAAGGPETVRADTPAEEPSTPEPEPAPEPESEIEPEPEPEPAPEPEPEPESDPLPVEVSPSQRRCSRRPTPRGKPGP